MVCDNQANAQKGYWEQVITTFISKQINKKATIQN